MRRCITGVCCARLCVFKVLQENVLRFVNLVGHVVHSNTMHYKGSPNKNIGDAFLLVWKTNTRGGKALRVDMPQTTDDLFPGFSSTKDAAEGATIADGALKVKRGALFQLTPQLFVARTPPPLLWASRLSLCTKRYLPCLGLALSLGHGANGVRLAPR